LTSSDIADMVVGHVEKGIRLRFVGLISLVANVIGALAGLAFIILVVRRLSPDDVGIWQWINRIISYALIPAFILNFWVGRFVARDHTNSRTALVLSGILSVPALLVYLLLIPIIAGAVEAPTFVLLIAAAFIPLHYLNTTMNSIAGGIQPQNVGYASISFESVKVILAFILVFTLQLALMGAIFSVQIAVAVQVFILIILMRKHLHGGLRKDVAKQWFSYSWLSGYLSQSTVLLIFDAAIVVALVGPQAGALVLAYFTVAIVISSLVRLAGSLATGLYPKLLTGGKTTDIEVVLNLALLFGIPMLIGTMVLARPLTYLYGPLYVVVETMTRIFLISTFLDVMSDISDFILLGTVDVDKTKPNFKELVKSRLFLLPSINLAMGACYLVTLYLVLSASILGASLGPVEIGILWAVSLVCVKLPFVLYKLWFSKRVMRFRIPYKPIARYLVAAAIMGIVLISCLQFVVYVPSIYQFFVYPLMLVGIGAVTYLSVLFLIDKEFRRLVRTILRLT
jgi:hypothetical protein